MANRNQLDALFSITIHKQDQKLDSNNKVTSGDLCRSLPGYSSHGEEAKLNSRILNGVECMLLFIGYPRSGHTLIGSLLDAHPNIVVANEYNVLENWANFSAQNRNRRFLYQQLYSNSYNEAKGGDRSSKDCLTKTKYRYLVPNQWQGKFNRSITVIGDKKGGRTSKLLEKGTMFLSSVTQINRKMKIPMKFIHVVRNPFDNVATIMLRKLLPRDANRQLLYENPLNVSEQIQTRVAEYYLKHARANDRVIKRLGKQVVTIHSEEVIKNPRKQLLKICTFLNVLCSKDYLKDCSSIVYDTPSKSRYTINWDDHTKNILLKSITQIPFFRKYKFNE